MSNSGISGSSNKNSSGQHTGNTSTKSMPQPTDKLMRSNASTSAKRATTIPTVQTPPAEITLAVDFGTSTSTASFLKNEKVINLNPQQTSEPLFYSIVKVTKEGLSHHPRQLGKKEKGIYLRNAKRLLGKTKKDFINNKPKEEMFGAPIKFDENGYPYYYCNIGTEKNPEYRNVYPEEVFGTILKKMKEDAEARAEKEMKYCCFTVPHFTLHRARHLMRQEARELGLECSFMMKEPTAAGIPSLIPESDNDNKSVEVVKEGETVLVFDFGGGTLDITIMRREGNTYKVLGTNFDNNLGGNDIDYCLFNYIQSKYEEDNHRSLFEGTEKKINLAKKQLLIRCREVKEELSTNDNSEISFESIVKRKEEEEEEEEEEDDSIIVTRAVFEKTIKGILDKCDDCWKSALKSSGLHQDDIDHVLLVGGSSRIPAIRKRFSKFDVLKVEDPQQIVVKGAVLTVQRKLIDSCLEEIVEADIGYYVRNRAGRSDFHADIQKGVVVCGAGIHVHHSYNLENGNRELPIYRRIVDRNGNVNEQQEATLIITDLEEDEWSDVTSVKLVTHVSIDGNVTFSLEDDDRNELGSATLRVDF